MSKGTQTYFLLFKVIFNQIHWIYSLNPHWDLIYRPDEWLGDWRNAKSLDLSLRSTFAATSAAEKRLECANRVRSFAHQRQAGIGRDNFRFGTGTNSKSACASRTRSSKWAASNRVTNYLFFWLLNNLKIAKWWSVSKSCELERRVTAWHSAFSARQNLGYWRRKATRPCVRIVGR